MEILQNIVSGGVREGIIMLGVVILTIVCRYVLVWIARRSVKRFPLWPKCVDIGSHFAPSFNLFLFLVFFRVALPWLNLSSDWSSDLKKGIQLAAIIVVTWLCIRLVVLCRLILFERYDISAKDNLEQRKVRTQIYFLEKILIVFLVLFGLCLVLMSFKGVREIGMGILTSAGVAGIVVGFAAQKSLGNLIAGFQIAFTQPLRIDDVVIVEGEWGKIEEITLTYVVVKIWDLRRLVLPITYFVDKPFENWTRSSSNLLGYIYLYSDYTLPLEEMREVFQDILKASPQWDKKVAVLQVTDSTERTMQLRFLMGAPDASQAWDLRCLVREKLIDHIQKKYPQCLPKTRFESGPL